MRLTPTDLGAALRRRIEPVYLVFGDEPLQLSEAVAAIRTAARANGFPDWELFFVQAGFSWATVRDSAATLPLFGGARVLDVRLAEKPDQEGARFLLEYAAAPSADCVLLLSVGKLTAEDQKKSWVQAFERAGAVVQVRPLVGRALLQWLDQRMSTKGLLADQSGLGVLASRVEGNLLAAAQEIEKLHILYGPGPIDDQQIIDSVADSARFDVFVLVDAVLGGRLSRAKRILDGLKGEGTPPAVVLWALAREARTLAGIVFRMAQGDTLDQACSQQPTKVFSTRKVLLGQAVARMDLRRTHDAILRCAATDRVIKGEDEGDPWDSLLAVCEIISGGTTGEASACGFPATAVSGRRGLHRVP